MPPMAGLDLRRILQAEVSEEQKQEAISKYEEEPDFRNFVKNLLRCRSLASLDSTERVTGSSEEKNDDIKVVDNKKRYQPAAPRGRREPEGMDSNKKHQQAMVRERRETEERSGRGDLSYKASKSRPSSDFYRDSNLERQQNNTQLEFQRNQPVFSTSTLPNPRREKRASVVLRERHEVMFRERGDREEV